MFRRALIRFGGGRRAAMGFVVCFECGGFFGVCVCVCVFFFFPEGTRPAASMVRTPCLVDLSTNTVYF